MPQYAVKLYAQNSGVIGRLLWEETVVADDGQHALRHVRQIYPETYTANNFENRLSAVEFPTGTTYYESQD